MLLSADTAEPSWSGVVRALVFGFGFLVLLTAVLIALLRTYADVRKARAAAAREEELRDLVRRYEQLAAATCEAAERNAASLAELRTTVDTVERLLRTVD